MTKLSPSLPEGDRNAQAEQLMRRSLERRHGAAMLPYDTERAAANRDRRCRREQRFREDARRGE